MEQLGHYRLEESLGRGATGDVFRAFDTEKGRWVALKRLAADLSTDGDFETSFRRASAMTAQLSEPHIVPIHDYGRIGDQLFLDMRLVKGRSLAAFITDSGPVAPARAVDIVVQVAAALDAAHAEGVVHGDVKPSHVLLDGDGEFPYLIDFGPHHSPSRSADATNRPSPGRRAYYTAPECLGDGPVDHRVDIYALGCLLFEALTGTPPFSEATSPQAMERYLHRDLRRPSERHPAIGVAFDDVIATALAIDPLHRYASAAHLAQAAVAAHLTAVDRATADAPPGTDTPQASGGPTAPRRRTLAYAGLATLVVASLVAIGILLNRTEPELGSTGITVASTVQVGIAPFCVALSPDGTRAFVCNSGSNNVSIVDTQRHAVVATVVVGTDPENAVLDQAGKHVYVSNVKSKTISVLDPERAVVTQTISVGAAPGSLALTPDGRRLLVVDPEIDTVQVIEVPSGLLTTTIPVGDYPRGIAVSPDGATAYVTNARADDVSIIDLARGEVTAVVPVGNRPLGVAFDPDGSRVIVANLFSRSISVIDTSSHAVTSTFPLGGGGPFSIVVGPRGGYVFVTDSAAGTLSTVGATDGRIWSTTPVGPTPESLSISPDGSHLYVANKDANTVTVLSAGGEHHVVPLPPAPSIPRVVSTIDTQGFPYRLVLSPSGDRAYLTHLDQSLLTVVDTEGRAPTVLITVGQLPIGVAISRDGHRVYVANAGSATVSVVDTGRDVVVATIPVGVRPVAVALSPDGRHAYVPDYFSSTVWVIDLGTQSVIGRIAVGDFPSGIAISSDGSSAYVPDPGSDALSVIDLARGTVTATIAVGDKPFAVALGPDGSHVYVTGSGTLSVIDTGRAAIEKTIRVATLPCCDRDGGSSVAISRDGRRAYVNGPDIVSRVDLDVGQVTTIPVRIFPEGLAVAPSGPIVYVAAYGSHSLVVIDSG